MEQKLDISSGNDDNPDLSDLTDDILNDVEEDPNDEEGGENNENEDYTADDFLSPNESEEEDDEDEIVKTGDEDIDSLELPENASAKTGVAFKTMRLKIKDLNARLAAQGNVDPEQIATLKEKNEQLSKQLEATDYKSSASYKAAYVAPMQQHIDVIKRTATEYEIPMEVLREAQELRGKARENLLKEHGDIAASIIIRELSALADIRVKAADAVKNFDPQAYKAEQREASAAKNATTLTEALSKASAEDPLLRESKAQPDRLTEIQTNAMKYLNGEMSPEEIATTALKAQTSDQWRSLYYELAQKHGVLKKRNTALKRSRPAPGGKPSTKISDEQKVNKNQNMDDLAEETMAL